MSSYLTADHVKKKKRKTGDLSLSGNVSYSEDPELEGSGEKDEKKKKKKKKKNKHRSTDDETVMDVGSLDNLPPSCRRSISAKFKEQEDTSEQELSNQDYNSDTWKSPKKSKKKKHVAVEETDDTGQPSLYDGHGYSDEVAVSGEALYSDSFRKKKKRHRPPENRSLKEEDLEDVQQTSSEVNFDIDMENPVRKKKKKHKFLEEENSSHDIQQTVELDSPCQVNSKKSRKKGNKVSVEEAGHSGQASLYDGHSEALHSDSVKKKKKRHRPPETRSSEEEFLEDVRQTSSDVMVNLDIDVENSVRKKKKKHKHKLLEEESLCDDPGDSDEVAVSEEVLHSESVRKKKKKHKHKLLEEESLYDDPGDSDEVAVSEEVIHSESVRRKKKKHKHKLLEEVSLYDDPGDSDEVAVSEEVIHSESVRKKKKRHRHSETRSLREEVLETSPIVTLSEDNLENSVRKKKKRHHYDILGENKLRDDIQQTVEVSSLCRVASKKSRQKNKEVSVEETDHTGQPSLYDGHTDQVAVSEEDLHSESARKKKKRRKATGADSTFGDESRTVGCLSPNVRNSVSEDMSFNEATDLESSERKKKKKHRTKEVDSQTESSICKPFKRYTSPERNGEDVAVAKRSQKLNGKYAEKAFENITEATNGKADAENAGTPAKLKKSIKLEMSEGNQDQDVTAELEESDRNLMETSLEAKTSVQRPKRGVCSANDILCTIPKRDLALLEEYFPKIRSRAGRTVEDLIHYELHRVKEAKERGVKFETGRFDSTEDELIKKNVEDFMKLTGLKSGEVLFHSYRFPEEKRTIEKLKKTFHFRQRIAKGLARTVKEVQNRGSKLYDLSGNKGRFSKEDVEKLQKGISEYGNNWTAIAQLVGRNITNTQLKASQLRHEVTGGKWSVEEVNLLLKAVKTFILSSLKKKGKNISRMNPQTVPKEMLFTGIPWAKMEKKVKTRNWTHCKSKWNDILLVRMNNGIRNCERLFGLQSNIEIIKWLHEAELRKGQVNWLEMAKAVGNIPPGILQQKVYKLKARHVPDWHNLSFKEVVDQLYQEVLPKLEAKVVLASTSQDTFDLPEKKDEFLISDIFEEYVGDDQWHLSKQFCIED